ncbi:uncharacterized protein LOC125178922 [Hyalella azteca]|uniref:Uncharacterized protein LOC125178922 n=1 Tax=Hyalella azteca TaxID=294128 RepID=A0A979FUI0_HYAAZ|nr:uncharacterized protein LOC125178922 [Hyalella azteca]
MFTEEKLEDMGSTSSDVAVPVISTTQDEGSNEESKLSVTNLVNVEPLRHREHHFPATSNGPVSSVFLQTEALSSSAESDDERSEITTSTENQSAGYECRRDGYEIECAEAKIKIEPTDGDVKSHPETTVLMKGEQFETKTKFLKEEKKENIARWWKNDADDEDEKPGKIEVKINGQRDEEMMPPPKAPPPSVMAASHRAQKISTHPRNADMRMTSKTTRSYGTRTDDTRFPPGISAEVWRAHVHSLTVTFDERGFYETHKSKASVSLHNPAERYALETQEYDAARPETSGYHQAGEQNPTINVQSFYQRQAATGSRKLSQPRRKDENVVSSSISDLV